VRFCCFRLLLPMPDDRSWGERGAMGVQMQRQSLINALLAGAVFSIALLQPLPTQALDRQQNDGVHAVSADVTAAMPACTYSHWQNGIVIGRGGGTAVLVVGTQPGCEWSAFSLSDFVSVSPAAGVGGGNLFVSVAPNDLPSARWGYVNISGQYVPVTQAGASPTRLSLDLNHDGRLDLLWQHQSDGRLATWTMDGSRQLTGTLLTPPAVEDTNWKIAGTGDLDGDGFADIVWQNVADGRVAAWLMEDLTLREGSLLSIPQVTDLNWRIATVGDFNGDGRADLVWQNQGVTLAVWIMDGLRVMFATHVIGCYSPAPLVGNGDFDGDGNLDLVYQNFSTGAALVCYMNGLQPIDGNSIAPSSIEDTNWKIRAVGDMNGDGWPDLVWQHETTGALGIWFMNGVQTISGTLLSPPSVSDLGWRIVGPK
jgi:hypothetical protein